MGENGEDAEAEMEDVGEYELDMREEESWEEVMAVLKHLKRGKVAGSYEIMNEMMYRVRRLVELMLLMINVV